LTANTSIPTHPPQRDILLEIMYLATLFQPVLLHKKGDSAVFAKSPAITNVSRSKLLYYWIIVRIALKPPPEAILTVSVSAAPAV